MSEKEKEQIFKKLEEKYKVVLVTGGAGFIGSNLVERLLCETNLLVISLDDYSAGKKENSLNFQSNGNFIEIVCDVTDKEGLERVFEMYQPDIVFHNAASKKNVCLKSPSRDLAVNGQGTLNLLELSRKYKIKKFVHASTGSVYGELQENPQTEKHPLNPASYYGVSKLCGERYCNLYNTLFDLNTTILRYFHVYGPRQDSHDEFGGVISIFERRAEKGLRLAIHGDGEQERSFTHVEDVVFINLLVAVEQDAIGEVYNCASGEKISVNQAAKEVLKKYKKEFSEKTVEYSASLIGDIRYFNVENAKIKGLGVESFTKFQDGIKNV